MQKKETMVKRFEKAPEKPDPQLEFYTKQVLDRREATENKLKLLHGSFFGRPIMKFQVGRVTDVWVPYCYLEYDFYVERNIAFRKKGLEKRGEVALVFDMNEMHPFQYDLHEAGPLPLFRGKLDTKGRTVLSCSNSFREVEAKAEDHIQYRIMKKFYGRNGDLTLKTWKKFFRPAVEMEIIYKGNNSNLRYAYLDEFGVESEHVLGLKYRVDNNF